MTDKLDTWVCYRCGRDEKEVKSWTVGLAPIGKQLCGECAGHWGHPTGEERVSKPDRYICTKQAPYTPEAAVTFGGRSAHPDAQEIFSETVIDTDVVTYKCPNCGSRWKEELPQ